MKTMKKMIIAAMAIVALTVVSATTNTGTANASSMNISRTITNAQVITYLQGQGFSLITVLQTYADGTRRCSTNHVGYTCWVYVNADQSAIVGWEETAG